MASPFEKLRRTLEENLVQLQTISASTQRLAENSLRTVTLTRELTQRHADHWKPLEDAIASDRELLDTKLQALQSLEFKQRTLLAAVSRPQDKQNMVLRQQRRATTANDHAFNAVLQAVSLFNESIQIASAYLEKKPEDKRSSQKNQTRIQYLSNQADLVADYLKHANNVMTANKQTIRTLFGADVTTPLLSPKSSATIRQGHFSKRTVRFADEPPVETEPKTSSCCRCFSP